ncbi:unnamed protein product [Mytilus coruscus]|uniref:Uncharacterized protein n=1 Tax=Mytilus coruscus TaxID=42192 RepID=A0A6J8DJC7_MYTCO|nr:unnamed protein product [Mytilus coruscus]
MAFQISIVDTTLLTSGCPLNPFIGRPPCNETCSKPPSISDGRQFICTVGSLTGWKDFNHRHGLEAATVFNNSDEKLFKAPLLLGIALHPLPYKQNHGFSPALNISFSIPFIGIVHSQETKAVLLTFESPVFKNPLYKKFTDTVYSIQRTTDDNIENDGRIYRLFDFSSYIPNPFDYKHQIVNTYPCLYGLDDCRYKEKIYSITLTSIAMNTTFYSKYFKCNPSTCSMNSLTYTVSVVTVRYNVWNTIPSTKFNPDFEYWNATIATTLFPSPYDIYVVFEHRETCQTYFLRYTGGDYQETASQHYTFKGLPPGQYWIEVKCCRVDNLCSVYKTFHEIIIGESKEIIPSRYEHLTKILLASAFCISILLVVVIALVLMKRRRKKALAELTFNLEYKPNFIPKAYRNMLLKGNLKKSTKLVTIVSNTDQASTMVANQLDLSLTILGLETLLFHYHSYLETEMLGYFIEAMSDTSHLLLLFPDEHLIQGTDYDERFGKIIKASAKLKNLDTLKLYFTSEKYLTKENINEAKKSAFLTTEFHVLTKFLNIKPNLYKGNTFHRIECDLNHVICDAEARLRNPVSRRSSLVPSSSIVSIDNSCPIHGKLSFIDTSVQNNEEFSHFNSPLLDGGHHKTGKGQIKIQKPVEYIENQKEQYMLNNSMHRASYMSGRIHLCGKQSGLLQNEADANERHIHKTLQENRDNQIMELEETKRCHLDAKNRIRLIANDDPISITLANKIIQTFTQFGEDISHLKKRNNTAKRKIHDEIKDATHIIILLPVYNAGSKFSYNLDFIKSTISSSLDVLEPRNTLVVNFPYTEDANYVTWKFLKKFEGQICLMKDFYEFMQFLNVTCDSINKWNIIKSNLSNAVDESETLLRSGRHENLIRESCSDTSIDSLCPIHGENQQLNRSPIFRNSCDPCEIPEQIINDPLLKINFGSAVNLSQTCESKENSWKNIKADGRIGEIHLEDQKHSDFHQNRNDPLLYFKFG